MTPADRARLTDEERTIAAIYSSEWIKTDYGNAVRLLLSRLAQARALVQREEHWPPGECGCPLCVSLLRVERMRAVVEAARDESGQHVTWCQCPLCRALAAHDAEAKE